MSTSTNVLEGRSTPAVDEVALIEGAAAGDADAFDALFRYLAPSAWDFASGISGDADLSAEAVVEGFATALTAVRAGRIDTASGMRRALMSATRNYVADAGTSEGHAGSDASLATAFGALPEKLRSALWLSTVDQWDIHSIGEVVGHRPSDTSHLINRGRQGLMVGVIRAEAGDNPRPLCGPSIDRLRRDTARNLTVAERALLRRHLRLCPDCQTLRVTAQNAIDRLPSLALPFPEALIDKARTAFAAVVAGPARGTGLAPRTEKVVAVFSASVAALGMAGATVWSTASPASQPSVAIGPVVSLVGGPQPPLELPAIVSFSPDADATGQTGTRNGTGDGLSSSSTTGSVSTGTAAGGVNGGVTSTASNTISSVVTAPAPGTSQTSPSPSPGTTAPGDGSTPPPPPPPPPPQETSDPLLKVGVHGVLNIELGDDPALDLGSDAEGTGVESGGFLDVLSPVTGVLDTTLKTLLG